MATIHDLPDEIILYICSFIPSKVVIATLSSVSRRFLELLSQGWYWRSRYVNSLSSQNTIGLLDELRMWQLGCIQGEFAIAAATGMAQNKQFKGKIKKNWGSLLPANFVSCREASRMLCTLNS